MPSDHPPILILMPDQLRADTMGCAGHPLIQTPNMDRLANEGVRFSNAHTVCPVCMPARASFINGLYPHNHHMWTNRGEMPSDDETFFHHLQKVGYYTAHIGNIVAKRWFDSIGSRTYHIRNGDHPFCRKTLTDKSLPHELRKGGIHGHVVGV